MPANIASASTVARAPDDAKVGRSEPNVRSSADASAGSQFPTVENDSETAPVQFTASPLPTTTVMPDTVAPESAASRSAVRCPDVNVCPPSVTDCALTRLPSGSLSVAPDAISRFLSVLTKGLSVAVEASNVPRTTRFVTFASDGCVLVEAFTNAAPGSTVIDGVPVKRALPVMRSVPLRTVVVPVNALLKWVNVWVKDG